MQAVEEIIATYARRATLEAFSSQSLRHSFVKNLLDVGVDLMMVKTLLGHERPETTARYTQPDLAIAKRRSAAWMKTRKNGAPCDSHKIKRSL